MAELVKLTITGIQKLDDMPADKTACEYEAKLQRKGDVIYLFFDEQDAEGNICKCRLELSKEKFVIKKSGAITSDIILEPFKLHVCDYKTPYITMLLGAKATVITLSEDKTIKATAKYTLYDGENKLSNNQIEIMVML